MIENLKVKVMEYEIEKLQNWYLEQSDGDWEHEYGITIETLDNPGWKVSIDLSGTYLEGREFAAIKQDESGTDWLFCEVRDHTFLGYGGALKLGIILSVFHEWSQK